MRYRAQKRRQPHLRERAVDQRLLIGADEIVEHLGALNLIAAADGHRPRDSAGENGARTSTPEVEAGSHLLFEGDVDEILGATAAPDGPDRTKPPTTSGMDALSLDDAPRHIVISAQKATLLMAVVVVLLALAFAAGYFLSPK